MRGNFYCSKLFLIVIAIFSTVSKKNNKKASVESLESVPEGTFADVIKNITRINDVLQELLKNYQKHQNLYKRQESLEAISSEFEKFRYEEAVKDKHDESTTRAAIYAGTQVFESPDASSIEEDSKEVNKTSMGHLRTVDSIEPKSNETAESYSETEDDDTTISSPKESKATDAVKTKPIQKKSKVDFTKKVTIVFKKPLNETNIAIKNSGNENLSIALTKQVIKAERFESQNIWNEIKDNKPLHMHTEREIIYTETKKKEENVARLGPQDTDLVEDEGSLKKEQNRIEALRKEYSDTCLKVLSSKCFSACKTTCKSACAKYPCKNNFTNTFKESAKKNCIKQFHDKSAPGFRILKSNSKAVELSLAQYLSAACLLQNGENVKGPSQNTNQSQARARLSLETGSQKISHNKCVQACFSATKDACIAGRCVELLSKELKSACNVECSRAFPNGEPSNSSDESTSASDNQVAEAVQSAAVIRIDAPQEGLRSQKDQDDERILRFHLQMR